MADPVLDDFLAALAPAKIKRRQSGKVSVTCWGHEDTNPSATVWIDDKGKIAYTCFVCDNHKHLTAELPQQARDIAAQTWGATPPNIELRLPRHKPTPPTTPTNGATAEYVYRDVSGDPLFIKKRYERDGRKTFVQYSPDGTKGRGDAPPVLYRLPDVTAAIAAGDLVFVVEGEKDADRLAELGFTATTCPDGAGKWDTTHSQALADAHVVILPDNDRKGEEHALDVLEGLYGVAETIRHLPLPELPDKGDVSDWLDAGHTGQDLLDLVVDRPYEYRQRPSYLADWQNIWELEVGGFLLEPMFLKGRGHSLYAGAKTGKSLFLLWLIVRELRRNPRLVVVYLDYEMGAPDLVERLEGMGIIGYQPWMDRFYYAMFPPMSPLDTEAGAQDLIGLVDFALADHPGCDPFVVIDTISRAVEGEENSSDTYRAFYRHTGMALKAEGITWCRVDHTGKDKGQGQRGSSAKNDDVDVVWEMTRKDDGGAHLKPTLQRVGNLEAFNVGYEKDPVAFTLAEATLLMEHDKELAMKAWNAGIRPHHPRTANGPIDQIRRNTPGLTDKEARAGHDVLRKFPNHDWSQGPPNTKNAIQGEINGE